MAILPTKNELKEVSLEALETYKEFLEEEITVRRYSEKQRYSEKGKQLEEVIELLNQAFDLAANYNIRINVVDDNAEIDIDVNDGEIYGSISDNKIIIDLFP